MFFGSDYGSERTCCLNGIDPQAYLRHWICPYISRHLLSLNPLLAR
ncbi:TPA: transposase domain-containing protein, partial [Escherichia coli]|nr:transposase domain-containing protein [Escherichia coli]ELS8141559.1 transposase domain-containing protein [Escherichia coli]HAW5935944.1 transposase domain-containing protein [Escherichia coli]